VTTPAAPPIEITCSNHFLDWLAEEQISLAFTTYQTNRLFLLGLKENGDLSTFERLFDRPMGLCVLPDRLYVGCRYQIWQLDNTLPPGVAHEGYDALYVPRRSFTTGDVDVHDVTLGPDGQLLFVNTLYSCLAALSDRYSFKPLWQPPFISAVVPEDRCHLNGLAVDETGAPRYLTAVSRSDVVAGWRQRRAGGGVVLDVPGNAVVMEGLSMPHSPRLHDGKLWLVNAGSGDFGYADLSSGKLEPVAFCPGFARGMAFHKHYAIIGLSKPRRVKAFEGLSLDDTLAAKDAEARCGVIVVDTRSGIILHWIDVAGIVSELYDVKVLPGVRRPMALGFKTDEVCRFVAIEWPDGPVFQPLQAAPDARVAPIDFMALRDPLASQPGVAVAPAQAPAARAPFAAPRPPAFECAFHTNLALNTDAILQHYAHLVFPPLAERERRGKLPTTLIAAAASVQNEVIGLALAEPQPEGSGAQLVSCAVAKPYRRQGVATQLLHQLETTLAQEAFVHLDLVYSQDWRAFPVVEHFLARHGWLPPQTRLYRYKGAVAALSQAEWLFDENADLPDGFHLFPWAELSRASRAAIERRQADGWYPPELSPFHAAAHLEPLTSMGLCAGETVIGWCITYRPAPDSIEYGRLFIAPEHRASNLLLPLLGAALRRQMESPAPYAICQIPAENHGMLAFVRRYLQTFVFKSVEVRVSRKML